MQKQKMSPAKSSVLSQNTKNEIVETIISERDVMGLTLCVSFDVCFGP